jgi:hypothetical protein
MLARDDLEVLEGPDGALAEESLGYGYSLLVHLSTITCLAIVR